MQTTGIIRKIDELGRIVLPKELRKYLNINPGDDFQITIENEKIILEKYSRLQNEELELIWRNYKRSSKYYSRKKNIYRWNK